VRRLSSELSSPVTDIQRVSELGEVVCGEFFFRRMSLEEGKYNKIRKR
jgi:hypothetical protein